MSRCKLQEISSIALAFLGGVALGQSYYYYLLKQIPFPSCIGSVVSIVLSGILGFGNAFSTQLRCISLLMVPMYCGKPGRGVLKAVVLTYIVAGPISNMSMNAREVVRVFACSTQLSYNLSMEKYALTFAPLKRAATGVGRGVADVKEVFRSINNIIEPIQLEVENLEEVELYRYENNFVDDLFSHKHRSEAIEIKFPTNSTQNHVTYYRKKLRYRCENQLSRAVAVCIEEFSKAYNRCCELSRSHAESLLCWPLLVTGMCDLITSLGRESEDCDSIKLVPSGFQEAYVSLKIIKKELVEGTKYVHVYTYSEKHDKERDGFQDAKETADRVQQAFEEKATSMHFVITVMNICMALLFLRIFNAAVAYHDMYLTSIDYDNVFITEYFKSLDFKRRAKNKYTLLPLKKMERNKYIDVHSFAYKDQADARNKLVTRVLKLLLEVVTTTTFVMLDRLFYEALDVVRQYAEIEVERQPTRDLEIEVEGTGLLGVSIRKLLDSLATREGHRATNQECLPRPRPMPYVFFFKIYGGYLWILLLLFINPYTMRLRRAICSYFYPLREKQRILHLYNDILKKRMKMDQTLRRKAVQAVRAHYLTGESLLSMRTKFPQLLGWLRILPVARTACLICGEIEPRNETKARQEGWYSCFTSSCPFVYCSECWHEAGARCLACEPILAELSDVDSLTEDETPAY